MSMTAMQTISGEIQSQPLNDNFSLIAQDVGIESGVFTPTLIGSVTAGVHTYSTQSGHYVKQGKLVNCVMYITVSSKDAAINGTLQIAGLPFPVKTSAVYLPSGAICNFSGITFTAGYTFIGARGNSGASKFDLFQSGSGVGKISLSQAALAGTTMEIGITATYETD